MSYAARLRRAVRIILRERSLWPLGLLPALLAPASLALALLGGFFAQAGLIAMVDEAAHAGTTRLHTGLRSGWRRGLQLVLITLLVGAPILVGVVALSAIFLPLTALPLLLIAYGGAAGSWLPVAAGVVAGLTMLALRVALALLALAAAAGILLELAYRRCVLAGEGVLESVRSACRLLRSRWRACLGTWLSLLAVSVALTALGAPVALVGLALAAVLAALLALAVHPLAALLLAGLPALLVAAALLALLTMAHILFHSTVWTLAYREAIVPHG